MAIPLELLMDLKPPSEMALALAANSRLVDEAFLRARASQVAAKGFQDEVLYRAIISKIALARSEALLKRLDRRNGEKSLADWINWL